MKVCLEILDSAFIYDNKSISELKEKELVPKMMMRRRLTRAAKILIYLSDKCNFTKGKVVFGSAYGELDVTASILKSIDKNEPISPTSFQNSVYNTAASYHSILHQNKLEVITVSSFTNTSLDVLRNGALLALDGDEVLLVAIETLNTAEIDEVNKCQCALESGVAMRVRITNDIPDVKEVHITETLISNSLADMYKIHEGFVQGNKKIEVVL